MPLDASVICGSFRPGGIDVLLAGMRDQLYPKDSFEVIFVDHRYERRHAEVMALAKSYGVNLIHAPEHRRNGKWAVNSSAFTTGFALARGQIVVMLMDWTYAPPTWLLAHLRHHRWSSVCVSAPYLYHAVGITEPMHRELVQMMPERVSRPWADYANQPALHIKRPIDLSVQTARDDAMNVEEHETLRGDVFDEVSVFEEGLFDPAWLSRMPPLPDDDPGGRSWMLPGVVHSNVVHLKNESLPREAVYRINGMDVWSERGGRMAIDSDFGRRVQVSGLPIIWDPHALAHCVNPRHGVCRVLPCGSATERIDGRWSEADCKVFLERRKDEVGRDRAFLPAPAPYTLAGLAEKLEPWRTAETIDTAGLDVPDAQFFGREIWPDSSYGADLPGAPA